MVYIWTEILSITNARYGNRTGLWLSELEKLLFWQLELETSQCILVCPLS